VTDGRITINVKANSGDIWVPLAETTLNQPLQEITSPKVTDMLVEQFPYSPAETTTAPTTDASDEDDWFFDSAFITNSEPSYASDFSDASQNVKETTSSEVASFDNDAFERGKIAGLQEAILAIMEKKGPVTDQMRNDVINNTHHDSLVNWVKSFH
jgi:hypothetical protein